MATRSCFPTRVARVGVLLLLAAAPGHAAPPGPTQPLDSTIAELTELQAGQVADSIGFPLPPDRRLALRPRRPDAARLRELAAQKEFQYEEAEQNTDFWNWLADKLLGYLRMLRGTEGGHTAWRYFWYAVMVAALVFAVLKLLQVEVTSLFGRAPRRAALDYELGGENIHELDFGARIAEAEEAGNYRLATRLGYLETLKHLTDAGLIDWQPDKTNHAYLHELAAGPQRESFREATRQFEYVWYGELLLPAALYRRVRAGQLAVMGRFTPTLTPA